MFDGSLNAIAECDQSGCLSSIGFNPNVEKSQNDCINAIYEYSLANFKNKIHMDQLADLVGMQFQILFAVILNHARAKPILNFYWRSGLARPAKLLIENKLPLKQLCYESGFNNLQIFISTLNLLPVKVL
ncbi:hypothetical protein ACFJIV_08250 [Mucilaginibacter sp. UC70_90]